MQLSFVRHACKILLVMVSVGLIFETVAHHGHFKSDYIRTSRVPDTTKLASVYDQCESTDNMPIHLVIVDNKNGTKFRGTTFMVADNIWITAAHVAGDIAETIIIDINGELVPAQITSVDVDADITTLRTYGVRGKPMRLQASDLHVGDLVWNTGYPGWAGENRITTSGKKLGDSGDMMFTSSTAMSGMSGGPTLTCIDDKLVAVGVISLVANISFSTSEADVEITPTPITVPTNYLNSGESFSAKITHKLIKFIKTL